MLFLKNNIHLLSVLHLFFSIDLNNLDNTYVKLYRETRLFAKFDLATSEFV